jgi:preprotein translocase SecF subunit
VYIKGKEYRFNFIGRKLYWFFASGALVLISILAFSLLGLNLGIEFKGGFLFRARLEEQASVTDVENILSAYSEKGLGKSIVQVSEDGLSLTLRMPLIADDQARAEIIGGIKSALQERYGIAEVISEDQVGAEWGREISRKAIISLVVFLAIILIYITFRFEFKMAIPAIVALVHDTIITVGIYALTRRQVTPATVIAFLTILGYSLYDTIVVFDRINENSNLMDRSGKKTYSEMVNDSVNQTLMRSIGTTLTTLLPILTILLFGGETLKDFAFALFIGVFLGAYSSIFLASPLLALWKETEPRYAAIKEKAGRAGARERVVKKPEVVTLPEEGIARSKSRVTESARPVTPGKREGGAARAATQPASPTAARAKKPAASRVTTRGPAGARKKKKKKKK